MSRSNDVPLVAEPFGLPLATQVTALLADGGSVLDGWCSHWMAKKGERFVYELLKNARREVFGTPDGDAFAAWLAVQSPRTLDAFVRPSCADTIEIITAELLAQCVAARTGVDDPTPYGRELAEKVVGALDRGVRVANDHRDYCGMGLAKVTDGYVYGACYDGYPDPEPTQVFATREAFVTWLAAQSDDLLAGREEESPFYRRNQRVTRARLLQAIGDGG